MRVRATVKQGGGGGVQYLKGGGNACKGNNVRKREGGLQCLKGGQVVLPVGSGSR